MDYIDDVQVYGIGKAARSFYRNLRGLGIVVDDAALLTIGFVLGSGDQTAQVHFVKGV